MRSPKHILITGASSGLGAALADIYAAIGIRLSLQGRNQDRLAVVANRVRQKGAEVVTGICDVTNVAALATWIIDCDKVQPLDLIIANAGISAGTEKSKESDDDVRAIFATNVTGVLNTINPILPLMLQRRCGQIAIMSSLASFCGFAGAGAYCASKAAIRVYGEALRLEVANKGVEVNVICPGFVKTPMTDVNRFPMPFLMSADRAAVIMRDGLAQNRARIAYPWQAYASVRLLAGLPQSWSQILSLLPKKGG